MSTDSEIIKRLERNTHGGRRQHQVFEDWLEIVEHSLTMVPAHARAIRETGHPAEDPPAIQHAWKRLRSDYTGKQDFTNFAEAYALLLESTAGLTYGDAVGNVYMQFGHPSTHAGQYFTPWPIAKVMAELTSHDLAAQVADRVSEALAPIADLLPVANLGDKPNLLRWVVERFLPGHAKAFKPITVIDPCVGSGVMLLATASCAPHWMSALGLIQYFGQDIDRTCVQMCRINLMLYGLNGFGIECWAELPIEQAPAAIRPQVEAVKAEETKPEPDRAKIAAIATEARKLIQPNLL